MAKRFDKSSENSIKYGEEYGDFLGYAVCGVRFGEGFIELISKKYHRLINVNQGLKQLFFTTKERISQSYTKAMSITLLGLCFEYWTIPISLAYKLIALNK